MGSSLDQRSTVILRTIVEEFISTGVPVGSRTIAKRCGLCLSSATIRNIMADLEEGGFLEQTHVSSGRVPTDLGYRFYVDEFSEEFLLKESEMKRFMEVSHNFGGQMEDLIKKVTFLLSNYSHLVSVLLTPKISSMVFRHIALVKLSPEKILVVIVSSSGFVTNKIIYDKWNLDQDSLNKMGNLLNCRLRDHYFFEYREILLKMLAEERNNFGELLSKAVSLGAKALRPANEVEIYIEGQLHVISYPEFSNVEKIRNIFYAFEEKSKLISLLGRCAQSKGVQIFIGNENENSYMKDYSLVVSKYAFQNNLAGALGVVGPKRMEYARVIPLVNCAANALSFID